MIYSLHLNGNIIQKYAVEKYTRTLSKSEHIFSLYLRRCSCGRDSDDAENERWTLSRNFMAPGVCIWSANVGFCRNFAGGLYIEKVEHEITVPCNDQV